MMPDTPDSLLQIFQTTKQEPLRLETALKGYFLCRDNYSGPEAEAAEDNTETETQGTRAAGDKTGTETQGTHAAGDKTGTETQGMRAAGAAEYRLYITRRIRPAVAYLADRCEETQLAALVKDGLVPASVRRQLLLDYADGRHPAQWMMLMRVFAREEKPERKPAGRGDAVPAHPAQRQEKDELSALRITAAGRLENIRMAVYRLFPFLDAVMAGLPAVESNRTESMGTDGLYLYYNAAYVTEQFVKNRTGLSRLYLHILLHCIWRHWNMEERFRCWLSADLQVEQMIEAECRRRRECREILGGLPEGMPPAVRLDTGTAAGEADAGGRDAAGESAAAAFPLDDHCLWPVPDRGDEGSKIKEANRRWELLSLLGGGGPGSSTQRTGRSGIGAAAGVEETVLSGLESSVRSYRSFLRQFAVLREELQIDPDSFDYIYYTLGMERYGSLPLIEPLEYTEGHKLEELVIAIDTSGSCTDGMVRSFLEETYAILGRTENFFRTMSVWVLQCDCTIQEKVHIRSADEWIDYCRDVKVKGRSGTDFRPVFKEVEALRESGEIRDLKCLIYFTDGEGIYPRESPGYETAFVRLHRRSGGEKTPRWALELYADEIG